MLISSPSDGTVPLLPIFDFVHSNCRNPWYCVPLVTLTRNWSDKEEHSQIFGQPNPSLLLHFTVRHNNYSIKYPRIFLDLFCLSCVLEMRHFTEWCTLERFGPGPQSLEFIWYILSQLLYSQSRFWSQLSVVYIWLQQVKLSRAMIKKKWSKSEGAAGSDTINNSGELLVLCIFLSWISSS